VRVLCVLDAFRADDGHGGGGHASLHLAAQQVLDAQKHRPSPFVLYSTVPRQAAPWSNAGLSLRACTRPRAVRREIVAVDSK